jgi:hypothetical protein
MQLEEIYDIYFNKENIKHAYLLETKKFDKVLNIVLKILLDSNTETENLEEIIKSGNYPDLKIIEPDGTWIKKEQISKLKDEFKSMSSFNNKQIYIIKNAENLNDSSANTILKFLEEPEENIIAILVTQNKNKVLGTIVSRCQHILLDSNLEEEKFCSPESIELYKLLETKKQSATFSIMKLLDIYEDREKIKKLFIEVLDIYETILLEKMKVQTNQEKNEEIDKYFEICTIYEIQTRMNGLISIIISLDYNINLKLLVDKLVILMFGVE